MGSLEFAQNLWPKGMSQPHGVLGGCAFAVPEEHTMELD